VRRFDLNATVKLVTGSASVLRRAAERTRREVAVYQRGGLVGNETVAGWEAADSADFASFYAEPSQTRYRGLDIVQMPPSGQGLSALLMLNILAGFDHSGFEPAGADRFHLQIEACRLAYGARDAYVADPAFAEVPVQELLSEPFAARLRERMDPRRAMPAPIVSPRSRSGAAAK